MKKPLFSIEKRRLFHPRYAITVYLLIALLTMGGLNTAHAIRPLHPSSHGASKVSSNYPYLIYLLLIAEIAATRQMPDTAMAHYLEAARLANDPVVSEESTFLALQLELPTEATFSAELWANQASNHLNAQLVAITLLIGQSVEKALPYLERALSIDPANLDLPIADIQARLSEQSAKNLNTALKAIAIKHPKNAYASLLAAQSEAQLGNTQDAMLWVDKALTLKPELSHAIELKSSLIRLRLSETGPSEEAERQSLTYIGDMVQHFPNDSELRFFYANALLDGQKPVEAKQQLSRLISDKIFGGSALLCLGEILLQEEQWIEAKKMLTRAQMFKESKDGAEYLLGELEERTGNTPAAIKLYSNIAPGPFHMPGLLKATTLLKSAKAYPEAISLLHDSAPSTVEEQKMLLLTELDLLSANGQAEEAMQLVNEILPKLPDDGDFLLMRASIAIQLKQWDIAENDLKKILQHTPNHAHALNTLGYMLSLNELRKEEAIHYLSQALSMAPNNPAFIDSMGYAYYRLGDLERAIFYLKQAHDLSEAEEIAAHLGEALWMNNQKDEALLIWKRALEKEQENAGSDTVVNTMKKFNVGSE